MIPRPFGSIFLFDNHFFSSSVFIVAYQSHLAFGFRIQGLQWTIVATFNKWSWKFSAFKWFIFSWNFRSMQHWINQLQLHNFHMRIIISTFNWRNHFYIFFNVPNKYEEWCELNILKGAYYTRCLILKIVLIKKSLLLFYFNDKIQFQFQILDSKIVVINSRVIGAF